MGKASKITLFKHHYNESAVNSQVDIFSILAAVTFKLTFTAEDAESAEREEKIF